MTMGRRKRPDIKGTMLCGAWVDSRTADAILADIRAKRNWLKKERRIDYRALRKRLRT